MCNIHNQWQVPQYISDAYLYSTEGLEVVTYPVLSDRQGWATYRTNIGVKWDGVPMFVYAKREGSIYIIETIHGRQFGVAVEDFVKLWPMKEINSDLVDY